MSDLIDNNALIDNQSTSPSSNLNSTSANINQTSVQIADINAVGVVTLNSYRMSLTLSEIDPGNGPLGLTGETFNP